MKNNSIWKKIVACGIVAGAVFALSTTVLPEKYAANIGLLSQVEASESNTNDDGYYCPGPRNGRGRHYRGGCRGCGGYNGQGNGPCWDDGKN